MLYFYNDETTDLFYDLYKRLIFVLSYYKPHTATAEFEDVVDKIILHYPTTEDSLIRFIPTFTPTTSYMDAILLCLSDFRKLNKEAFLNMKETNPLHARDVEILREALSSPSLFKNDTKYFLNYLPVDGYNTVIQQINSALSKHTWLSLHSWILNIFLQDEINRDCTIKAEDLLVPRTLLNKHTGDLITSKGLDLIRTNFFSYLQNLYKDSYFACHACLTYESLETCGKKYCPMEVF